MQPSESSQRMYASLIDFPWLRMTATNPFTHLSTAPYTLKLAY